MMNGHHQKKVRYPGFSGTFVPKWEDVENDLEPNLRELLERKRKRMEAPTANLEVFHAVLGLKRLKAK